MQLIASIFAAAFVFLSLIGCGDTRKQEMRAAEAEARAQAAAKEKEKTASAKTSDTPPVATGEEKTPAPPKDPPKGDPAPAPAAAGDVQQAKVGEHAMNVPKTWTSE